MDVGQSVNRAGDRQAVDLDRHHPVGAEMGDIEAAVSGVEVLVIEADRRTGHQYVGDGMQRKAAGCGAMPAAGRRGQQQR